MGNKNKIKVTLTLILLVGLVQFSSAANVGVSPADLSFKNVLRNGYAERPFVISVDVEDPINVTLEKRGEIEDWVNFEETSFLVSRENPAQVFVSITPPSDVPNGNYTGFIRVKGSQLGDTVQGSAVGIVTPVIDAFVTVEITDQEVFECKASDFKVVSAEEGEDIIFTLGVLNNGNTRINPRILIDIWDQESVNLVKQVEFSKQEIIPTKKEELRIEVSSRDLDIGQYWADMVAVDCVNSRTVTFDVLEEGALRASGVLENIIITTWAEIGDIVPVSVNFKNTGEKNLEASFSGKISLEDKIVQLLESDEDLLVPVSEESAFQFYFTPQKAGRYIFSGRVFYDGKRTYEKSGILNVRPSSNIWGNVLEKGSYIALIIIISILLYKIRIERKAYFRRAKIKKWGK